MMNKRLLLALCCTLLLSLLAFGIIAQQEGCNVDYGPIQTALANAQSAGNNSDTLAYLIEAQSILEGMVNACGGGLNWCYPGQPWGDGRCNGPDLTQEQIDWFWACGTYWAEYEAGLLDVVPEWCGYVPDSDGDGYADDVDQCPNQGGYVDDTGCPLDCNPSLDADCDGTPDTYDQCPHDPNKIAPGVCGCGVSDADSDGDGTPDCNDQCPADPNKTAPGTCGCGSPDTDSDSDGILNCNDACPNYNNTACEVGWCQIRREYRFYDTYDTDGKLVETVDGVDPGLPSCGPPK